jgi:hypothetical protein
MSETPPRSRITDLVAEARKALDLRERLVRDHQDPAEVDEALEGLYRDIGAAMVDAVGTGAMIPEFGPGGLTESFTNELPGHEDDGSWYTDEVDDALAVAGGGPIFDPGELDDETDVPEPDQMDILSIDRSLDETDPGLGGEFTVESAETLAVRVEEDRGSGLAQLRLHGPAVPWRAELDELLELLSLPPDFDDVQELTVEASRVQWAASEIDYRLQHYPDDVKVCLVGLLAARAQHLRGKLDVDVGLRTSLDRLQRYRIDMDLPSVAGLLPTPTPEHGTWPADVRAWWALLRPGSAGPVAPGR